MFRSIIRRLERSRKLTIKQLELSSSKAEIARDEDLEIMVQLWKAFQTRKVKSYDNFFNVCIYASLVGRDIAYLSDSFVKTQEISERNVVSRLLSMTLIEFLDDINGLLGKDLRTELQMLEFEQHLDQLRSINKAFSSLKKENQAELRKIRNNAAAHKTKNALSLLEFNKNVDSDKIFTLSAEVSQTNVKLTKLTTQILYSIIDEQKGELEVLKIKSQEIQVEFEELKKKTPDSSR